MTTLVVLWLPILVSAAFVFVVSSVIHMALPIHKDDYAKLPDEDRLLDGLRSVPAGQYVFPRANSMKDMSSPAMQEKFKRGPVGTMIIRTGNCMNIGPALLQWFVFCIVIGICTAYLTGLALAPGAASGTVFRIAGTAAVLCHAFSSVNDSIWKGVKWSTTIKFLIDGIVYGLVTGATFAWLWPAAAPV